MATSTTKPAPTATAAKPLAGLTKEKMKKFQDKAARRGVVRCDVPADGWRLG